MNQTIEAKTIFLFDDPSAVKAFIRKGWLEKVADGKTPDETLCRYTPQGLEFQGIISRFQAN